MQIVIDIAENVKKQIDDGKGETELGIPLWLAYSISKGTPLPKGHGELVDISLLYQNTMHYSNRTRDLIMKAVGGIQ